MSNNYIYPVEKFNIKLDLEVSVKFVGMWDGIPQEILESHYEKVLKDGDFEKMLKDYILTDLRGEEFDVDQPEPFDRLAFTIK